jgi:hypothetical protein
LTSAAILESGGPPALWQAQSANITSTGRSIDHVVARALDAPDAPDALERTRFSPG